MTVLDSFKLLNLAAIKGAVKHEVLSVHSLKSQDGPSSPQGRHHKTIKGSLAQFGLPLPQDSWEKDEIIVRVIASHPDTFISHKKRKLASEWDIYKSSEIFIFKFYGEIMNNTFSLQNFTVTIFFHNCEKSLELTSHICKLPPWHVSSFASCVPCTSESWMHLKMSHGNFVNGCFFIIR